MSAFSQSDTSRYRVHRHLIFKQKPVVGQKLPATGPEISGKSRFPTLLGAHQGKPSGFLNQESAVHLKGRLPTSHQNRDRLKLDVEQRCFDIRVDPGREFKLRVDGLIV